MSEELVTQEIKSGIRELIKLIELQRQRPCDHGFNSGPLHKCHRNLSLYGIAALKYLRRLSGE